MKDNLDWYRHDFDSDQHPKFKALRATYGWAGEGRFWALNNRIARAPDCWLDVGKPFQRAVIAEDLDLKVEELDAFLEFLADRSRCGLVIQNDNLITTDRIQDRLSAFKTERDAARLRKENRRRKDLGLAFLSSAEQLDDSPEPSAGVHAKAKSSPELDTSSPELTPRLDQTRTDQTRLEAEEENPAAELRTEIAERLEAEFFILPEEELAALVAKLQNWRFGVGFVAFAITQARKRSGPGSSFTGLLHDGLLKWDDWYKAYQVKLDQEAKRASSKVPLSCPECGEPKSGRFRGINGEWWGCQKCGAIAHWRNGAWKRDELADTS